MYEDKVDTKIDHVSEFASMVFNDATIKFNPFELHDFFTQLKSRLIEHNKAFIHTNESELESKAKWLNELKERVF